MVRTKSYMLHPIFNQEGELLACIQVISKLKNNSKQKSKLFSGFTNFDEMFLRIYGAFVQAKI